MKTVAIFPGSVSFEIIINCIKRIESIAAQKNCQIKICFVGKTQESARISARLYGFTFVETNYNKELQSTDIKKEYSYGRKRSYIRCFADNNVEGRKSILRLISPDYIIVNDPMNYNELYDIKTFQFQEIDLLLKDRDN